jgi:hypothetical protein
VIALQLAVTVPEVVGTLAVGATVPSATFTAGQEVARVLTLPPGGRGEAMLGFLLSEQGQRSEQLVAETRVVLVGRRSEADARRTNALLSYDVADRLGSIAAPTLLGLRRGRPARAAKADRRGHPRIATRNAPRAAPRHHVGGQAHHRSAAAVVCVLARPLSVSAPGSVDILR